VVYCTEFEIKEAVVGIKEATTKLENRETPEADKRVYRKTIDHLQRKGEHLQRKIEYFQRRIECLQAEMAEIRGARQEVLHAQGSSACFEDTSDLQFESHNQVKLIFILKCTGSRKQ
jgi:predicted RNase H-like nuclease (RuvC/YqgF family)